jgi:hypothetical protein
MCVFESVCQQNSGMSHQQKPCKKIAGIQPAKFEFHRQELGFGQDSIPHLAPGVRTSPKPSAVESDWLSLAIRNSKKWSV